MNMTDPPRPLSSDKLIESLRHSSVYPDHFESPVVVHQTHISWVVLAGDYAYKVKKPIRNDFLDYSTLERRKHFCGEELRLDARYAKGLYIGVVPIRRDGSRIVVDGDHGEIVEYAVKMHRFPEQALLSQRLQDGMVEPREVERLAERLATFHDRAERSARDRDFGTYEIVLEDALDNFRALQSNLAIRNPKLAPLKEWTTDFADRHRNILSTRLTDGFIRECHGDMHLENVVQWQGEIVPFDGIEFCDRFRWIDVASDTAFLAMDFASREHPEFANLFRNRYLEFTGDYASLPLMRWYLVYRALVRAKVASLTAHVEADAAARLAIADCQRHIDLAESFCRPHPRRLWITHGLSGSGKTYGSDDVVRRCGAIRLRSDIERKRQFGLAMTDRPDPKQREQLYSRQTAHATYDHLHRLAENALSDEFGVVVDATFLRRIDRDQFRKLASDKGAEFSILHFHADEATLRRRIVDRAKQGGDASDADLAVLDRQLASHEPLQPDEYSDVIPIASPENSEAS